MKYFHPKVVELGDLEFIAAWVIWFKEYGPGNRDWTVDPMPVRNSAATLSNQIQQHGVFTCDVLCRVLRGKDRDTMQATRVFREDNSNSKIIDTVRERFPGESRVINAVRITEGAVKKWRTSERKARSDAFNSVYSLISDDLFIENNGTQRAQDEIVSLDPVSSFDYVNLHSKTTARKKLKTRNDYLKALVQSIQQESYQPMYRKRPIGEAVSGWDCRLSAYFWPIPGNGLRETWSAIEPIIETCNSLGNKITQDQQEPWSSSEKYLAIQVAKDIFKWGGVPQISSTVTASNIRMVFENAIANHVKHSSAPMNSGWTKVAAFASHNTSNPQVIWDSRVSLSIIYRLDALMNKNKQDLVHFKDIGYVSGRGGFREFKKANLGIKWPDGYRKWSTQIAGSILVNEIVDILNNPQNKYPKMPDLTGTNKLINWTTRGVEMVLFGDGY